MSVKPEILFLSHRIPYPPDKGDKIRSWRLFDHLARRFRVHLACFIDDVRDFAHTEFLKERSVSAAFLPLNREVARLKSLRALASDAPLTFEYFYDRKMAAAVCAMREQPLAAEIAFSSSMAPYIAEPVADRKRIVDFCDADSEKWRRYGEQTPGPTGWIYKYEARALARAETKIVNWADASFAITPEEAAIFNRRRGVRRKTDWWSNGVDAAYFDPALTYDAVDPPGDVVFIGAMDYRANVDAVLDFIRNVWPVVRRAAPDARFAVIGADPPRSVRSLHGVDGVAVAGRVGDVRPFLRFAKAVVAPLRVGRGVQNKVLEAMAMAKAVVATPEAALGVKCSDDDLCVAAHAAAMADEIVDLLADPERRRRIGDRARAAILARYDWDSQLSRFDAALDKLGLYSSPSRPSGSPAPPVSVSVMSRARGGEGSA